MKKGLLFCLCLIAMVVMLALMVSAQELVYEANASNSGSDDVWVRVYQNELGEHSIVVSGNGSMRNVMNSSAMSSYRATTTSAVIEDGVKNITGGMFENFSNLKEVYVGRDVMEIGSYAFRNCTMLESVSGLEGVNVVNAYAFYNCTALMELAFSDCLGKINDRAMFNCAALEAVTLGEGLTYIGTSAFEGCCKLQSVSLPDTVENMGTHVFRNCNALENIKFSKGLTAIGSYAFQGCYSLKSVKIPGRVITIGANAFQQCTSLNDLIVEEGVLEIGNYAFDRCSNLQSAVLPDTVTYIGTWCFGNNQALNNIVLGNGIIEIGASAFYGCCTLAQIYIPSSVELVGDSAFRGCSNLTIYLGAASVPETWSTSWNTSNRPVEFNVTHSHSYEKTVIKEPTHLEEGEVLYVCTECGDSFTQFVNSIPHTYTVKVIKEATHKENGEKEYSCNCGYSYVVAIAMVPHSYVQETTLAPTHLKEGVYTYTCSCGESYQESIAKLPDHSYVGTVTLEPTHTESGEMTYLCECGDSYISTIEKLGHTYNEDGVCSCGTVRGVDPVEIWNISINTRENVAAFLYEDYTRDGFYRLVITGEGRFRNYKAPWTDYKNLITEIVIEDGILYEIPNMTFADFCALERVKIGKGIERIGCAAFRRCEALISVDVTENLRRIDTDAFRMCTRLEEINGIGFLEFVGSNSFNRCESLREFKAERIEMVWDFAFADCIALERVDVIGGIANLRNAVFRNCQALREVKNIDNLKQFGRDVFVNCLSLETLVLSKAVYELSPYAFQNCKGLKTVIILGEIEKIPDFAFRGCSNLKTVYVASPYPVSIGNRAFEGCDLLESVACVGGIADIGDFAFDRCRNLTGVMLTERTTSIGNGAFWNCTNMKEIFIPNSVQSIGANAFQYCNALTIYTQYGVYIEAFSGCNPRNRPVYTDCEHSHFSYEYCNMHEHGDYSGEMVELDRTHFSLGLIIYKCTCGASLGHIMDMSEEHEFGEYVSEGNVTHKRACYCGYVEVENHTFSGGTCTGCGLKKNVLVLDDIESIEASNGKDLSILFDGLKNTTGLLKDSVIEYYPNKDRDYILITLKDEVDLGGITLWICGEGSAAKITVYDENNRKTGEGKVEFNGGDYSSFKSLPANVTFFGTARTKYIKIEAERLGKEGGIKQKISEIELVLGTKIDLDSDKPNTKIDLVLDIPTLNAIGVELTPELLEKLEKGLELNSDIGQIILDAISMGKVSSYGGNVTIGINEITTDKESKTGKRVFSITVNDENGNPILPPSESDENGTLTLSFKYHKGLKKEQIKVVYRDENGKIEHMEVEHYDPATGEVRFKTKHLSDYEIYADGISNDGLLDGAFAFKGYSVNETTGQISVGYSVNYDIINEYEEIMGKKADFGIVFASYELLDGKNPFDENGDVVILETGKVIDTDLKDFGYTNYEFILMDLTEDLLDHQFVISAYAKGEDGVCYYQDGGMSDTVTGVSYNEALAATEGAK